MSKYETEVILLAWNVSAGSHGHWVKFKLPVAITEGHPFALFDTGAENGQRFRMTFEAIGNDEQPQGLDSGSAPPVADAEGSPASAPDGGSTPVTSRCPTPQAQTRGAAEPATKPKKHWDDLSPSQQAGIVCNNHRFDDWLGGPAPGARWDGETIVDAPDLMNPADYVRWYCGVSSRADLDTSPEAAKRWRELYGMFQADTTYGERR